MNAHAKMLTVLVMAALAAGLTFVLPALSSSEARPPALSTYKGITAARWAYRYRKEHIALTRHGELVREARRQAKGLSRQLATRGGSYAILAIRAVFGPYAEQAIRVSACETGGTFSTNAQNGQYLGLFQMGDYARGAYGHSSDALGQAIAAYRYFVASGRDWSPWECKP